MKRSVKEKSYWIEKGDRYTREEGYIREKSEP
jgi:hypothetical protein